MEFFVVRHPLDGLQLALGLEPPAEVLLAGHSLAGAALLGLEGPPSQPCLRARWQKTRVTVLGPHDGPYAGLLDQTRSPAGEGMRAVLLYDRLEHDLPPLQPEDRVRCFWEFRDLLEDGGAARLRWLGQRIQESGATHHGLTLYSRRPLGDGDSTRRREQLERKLGSQCAGPILELQPWEVSR